MVKSPKVSVLVSVYNAEGTIASALQSVVDSGYDDFELVIVDDGSTDGTVRRIMEWAVSGHGMMVNDWLKIFKEEHAGHIAKARNRTLKHARGQYIIVLDADDEMLPGCLQRQVEFLDANPGYGFTHTPCLLCDKELQWRGVYLLSMPAVSAEGLGWNHDPFKWELYASSDAGRHCATPKVPEDLFEANLAYSFINNWGCLIRKSLMDQVGGWSEDLPGNGCGEDYDLNLKLARATKAKWINQLSIKFRKDQLASAKRWDADRGPFANYPFIQAKHRALGELGKVRLDTTLKAFVGEYQCIPEDEIKGDPVALDIGCGDKWVSIPGYVVKRLDSRASTGADYVMSADDLSGLAGVEPFDMIYSSHVLEHFPRAKASIAVRQWLRVLKVGGKVEVYVPDFELLCQQVLSKHVNEHDLHCRIFGAHSNAYDAHHSYFTRDTLHKLFQAHGVRVDAVDSVEHNNGSIVLKGQLREWKSDDDLKGMIRSITVSPLNICKDDKIVQCAVVLAPESHGKEMVFEFLDALGQHTFYWMCDVLSDSYTASLYLTPDILSVKGNWMVNVWLNGVLIGSRDFIISEEKLSKLDLLIQGYRAEE